MANSTNDESLPIGREYFCEHDLFEAINDWSLPKGFTLIPISSINTAGKGQVTYECDTSWVNPLRKNKRAKCPFSVMATESDQGLWTVGYRPERRFSVHNHGPRQKAVPPLKRRKISPSEGDTLHQDISDTTTPEEAQSDTGDDQNERDVQALAKEIKKNDFWSRMVIDSDGQVKSLFFSHMTSIDYLRAFPQILIFDCAYKANRNEMFLYNIMGVNPLQKPFSLAFAFLSSDIEPSYTWALNQLKSLYKDHDITLPSVIITDRCQASINAATAVFPSIPNLLSHAYANKAVLSGCRRAFSDVERWNEFNESWQSLISSPTEGEYEKQLAEFQERYTPDHLKEVTYVNKNLLIPFKTKLVKAWIDKHTHFGMLTTTRIESINSILKPHLVQSPYELLEFWNELYSALLTQLSELYTGQVMEHARTPYMFLTPLYKAVTSNVSHHALKKVEEHRTATSSAVCNGNFSRIHGLPCCHSVDSLEDEPLQLAQFDPHWYLRLGKRPPPAPKHIERFETLKILKILERTSVTNPALLEEYKQSLSDLNTTSESLDKPVEPPNPDSISQTQSESCHIEMVQIERVPAKRGIELISGSNPSPNSKPRLESSDNEVAQCESASFTCPRSPRMPRAPSKCTKCGGLGHTRTSKACPLRVSGINVH